MRNKSIIFTLIAISFIISFIAIEPFIMEGKGFFTVADDFNEQQLTFATALIKALQAKSPGQWIWQIDLGSSLINTFSFYNLGSPFFWLFSIFPPAMIPYTIGYQYMLKYVIAALIVFFYLRTYVNNPWYAVLGSLLYAFSGYQATNLEFFHFHDVVAFFPLLLIGLEKAFDNSRYYLLFVFAVFINCINNYFFFVQEIIFILIYYIFRYWDKPRSVFLKKGVAFLFCGVFGMAMAFILLLPGVIFLLGNSRSSLNADFGHVIYDLNNILFILKGMLLPGDTMNSACAVQVQNWNSTSCYIPFFGLSLTFSYILKKNDWLKKILVFLGVVSLSPILQSGFLLFKATYQRWWYMFVLLLILATIKVLDSLKEFEPIKTMIVYIIVVSIFMIYTVSLHLVFNWERFVLFYSISIAGPAVLIWLIKTRRFTFRFVFLSTICFCVLTTFLTIYFYRCSLGEKNRTENVKRKYELGLHLPQKSAQYRYNTTDNMYTIPGEAAGIGGFCSTLENSSRDFNMLFDIDDFVTTKKREEIPGLSALLAGKYDIINKYEGFKLRERTVCPIGFFVDQYITESDFMKIPLEKRAYVLMNSFVLKPEQEKEIDPGIIKTNYLQEPSEINTRQIINKTIKNSAYGFERDHKGFKCKAERNRTGYLYFTVPYSRGWSAYIDGNKETIINSGGMMLIKVPTGRHDIVFRYQTPGFKVGMIITIISGICFFICLMIQSLTQKNFIHNI